MKAMILLDDLFDFAQRQLMVEEIVLLKLIIVQHDGNFSAVL
jgi:hypothetical protein